MNTSETDNNVSPTHEDDTALSGLAALRDRIDTAILGTVTAQGVPSASYAPYIVDSSGNFYIYISALAKHTGNLKRTQMTSVMLVEDEHTASSLFARKRATWDCDVEVISRDSEEFNKRIHQFTEKFGDIVTNLSTMTDFTLFRLLPQEGVLVLGFGQAYRLDGWDIANHKTGRHSSGHKRG